MGTTTYVGIQDDCGVRSLSANERDFLSSCALTPRRLLRVDGRGGNDPRKVRFRLGRWDNGAECTVQWGSGTRVTSLCTADLVPPSFERPNEGIVNFKIDLSPMACASFRQAPPVSTAPMISSAVKVPNFYTKEQKLLSNRILRCVERIVLVGGALDTEALVLIPGKWVWCITMALTVLDDGGNLLDACVLAAIASLKHYRKPQVDFWQEDGDNLSHPAVVLPTILSCGVKEATPLPLHHTPLSISFALVSDEGGLTSSSSASVVALVDPTDREELVQFGSLTIAMNVHGEVCLLDYCGGCELSPMQLKECGDVAGVLVGTLSQLMEETLAEADQRALDEQLQKFQSQKPADVKGADLIHNSLEQPIFANGTNGRDELLKVSNSVDLVELDQARGEAEDEYRRQVLDFSKGHVPSAIRDNCDPKESKQLGVGSLLASMLKSAELDSSAPLLEDSLAKKAEDSLPATGTKYVKNTPEETEIKEESCNFPISSVKDDEEESRTVLQSEVGGLTSTPDSSSGIIASKSEEPPEASDLSIAIKKKKSKRKKK